jgi:hypothetical protein
MRTVKALMVGIAVGALLVLPSSPAVAVTFTVDVSVGFVPPGTCDINAGGACLGFDGQGGLVTDPNFTNTGTRMQWDVLSPSINSFLGIGALPPAGGFPANVPADTGAIFPGFGSGVINPGETLTTAQVRHTNNTMSDEDDFLASVVVGTLLELRAPDNTLLLGGFVPVPLTFVETDNVGGQCPAGSVSVCDDVFNFPTLDTDLFFSFDGIDYVLHLRGLVNANGTAACTPDPNNPGFVNCLTAEGVANDRFVQVSLEQLTVVPAPASLLLVGLGLVGAGVLPLIRRRRAA